MKKKQFLLTLLAVLLPLSSWADTWQDPETMVNYQYTVGSGVACVSEGFFMAGSPEAVGDITIRSKITVDGHEYTVTSIGSEAFSYCAGITRVVIPATIETIGGLAFNECTDLSEIVVPCGSWGQALDPDMGQCSCPCPVLAATIFYSENMVISIILGNFAA